VLLTKAGHLNHDSPIKTEWKISVVCSEHMMDEEKFQNCVYQYRHMNITCEEHISTNPIMRSAMDNPIQTKDKIMKTRELTKDKQS
jgi:hypothetical protein